MCFFETECKKQVKEHIAIIQGIHSNNSLGYTVEACSKKQGIHLQAVGIDRDPGKSIQMSVDIERYPCKPISLSNRYRSISLRTYRFNQQVLLGGHKIVLFERQPTFKICWCPRCLSIYIHLRNHIGRTIGCCGHCPYPIDAYHTYRQTSAPNDCAPREVSILIIADLLLAQ